MADSISEHAVVIRRALPWLTGGKYAEVKSALDALVALSIRQRNFIQDVADHGLRTDMHPTIQYTPGDDGQMYVTLTAYFSKSEENLRTRAKELLDG